MKDSGLLGLALLFLLGNRRESQPAPNMLPPNVLPWSPISTVPWPQVVPEGLPSFPGSGWEPDEPPPPAVIARAKQLVDQLWAGGSGTFKTEQVEGRWITFRAEIVRSGKKGVVAYRVRAARATTKPPMTASRAPATRGSPAPAPRALPPAPSSAPAPLPSAVPTPVAATPAIPVTVLPTLRRGAGLKPYPPDPNVKVLQRKLGIAVDGQFGKGTEDAVRAFQKANGLTVDGIVGPITWTKVLAGGRA